MIKTSTPKFNQSNDNDLPSNSVIQNILNYSKALKVYKTTKKGVQIEQILN